MTNDEILAAAKTAEPLLYTTEGNLPVSQLVCKTSWQFVHKEDETLREIWCIREWFHNDVMVKREPSIFLNEGAEIGAEQGQPA